MTIFGINLRKIKKTLLVSFKICDDFASAILSLIPRSEIFIFDFSFLTSQRLTPPYMLILMISACLTKYLGDGPFYPKDGFETNYCKDTWWQNLLYINNFGSLNEKVCSY
jgi:hypothetical protein